MVTTTLNFLHFSAWNAFTAIIIITSECLVVIYTLVLFFFCFSDFQVQERSKATFKDESFEERAKVRKHLTCCRDCSLNFEKEAKSIANSITISKRDCTTSLPTWLKNCKEERSHVMDDQVIITIS